MTFLKSAFLLIALTLLLMLLGDRFGGQRGLLLRFLLAAAMNFLSYFYSDRIAPAMYRTQPVVPGSLPRVERAAERLAERARIPLPKLFVIPLDTPNAFATGRDPEHASVAVTSGILQLLDDRDLEGVLAHELGHVRNRDILISSIATTLAGAIILIARMGYWASLFGGSGRDRGIGGLLMLFLALVAAMLIQFAVSRSREYAADVTGAGMTGDPYALASALERLEAYNKRLPFATQLSTAHMFIIAPAMGGAFVETFSTHSPTKKRVERLTGRPSFLGAR